MNKILLDHWRFLARHDYPIPRDARLEHLTDAELQLLKKYGTWMEAMEQGLLTPITSGQRHFLLVCEGREAPATEFAIAWEKLKRGMRTDVDSAGWKSRNLTGVPPRVWMVCPSCGGIESASTPCPNCGGTGWLIGLSPRTESECATARSHVGGAERNGVVLDQN